LLVLNKPNFFCVQRSIGFTFQVSWLTTREIEQEEWYSKEQERIKGRYHESSLIHVRLVEAGLYVSIGLICYFLLGQVPIVGLILFGEGIDAFVPWLAERGMAPASVDVYLGQVGKVFEDEGFPNPVSREVNPAPREMAKGYARLQGFRN